MVGILDVVSHLEVEQGADPGPMYIIEEGGVRIFTRKGCQDIVRAAFEYAKKFGYKTVTVVEKPNVVRETSGLMVREARKIARDYPGIELWETNIDAMCMWLVKNPQDYGVMVCSNMFGDIISDGFASGIVSITASRPWSGSEACCSGCTQMDSIIGLMTSSTTA